MFKKKGLSALLMLLIVSIVVTACGGSNDKSTPTPQASSEPAAPRVVKHAMGEAKVTAEPKRVVVLTNQGTESLLELGIKPVGAVKSWIGDPWYDHIKDQMADVTVVGDETQPNLELIASLKPDLILGTKVRQEKIYQQLEAIAPTVLTENLGDSMIENFELYAQALNKEKEGAAFLEAYNKTISDVKSRLGDKTKAKVSLARFQPGKVRVYYKENFAGVILEDLGFSRPDAQNKDDFSADVTKEQIDVLDGDVLFYFTSDRDGDTGATKTADEWLKGPLAEKLNVVTKQHIFNVNEPIWNTAGGVIAAKLLIQDIEERFSKLTIQ
ncbi:iron siderophore-binding protein [Paenibacillus sp. L3-i20]|nr:iron siderophore-binding protein [Paenibacillus sp. L3-i20]